MSQLPTYSVADRKGTKTVSTGSAWEPKMGYSRAVRKGNMIFVTGTVGINADKTYTPDVGAQAKRSLDIITGAIESLGGKITDVVRTRMYVTDVSQWEKVAVVHGAVFSEIRPATTIVEVAKLIDGEALIEIEADAMV
jgi:enamine deaminase RidA (YjgF/YER057c/UK114 family)